MIKKVKALYVEHLDNSRKVALFINANNISKDNVLLLEHNRDCYVLFYYKEED